MIKVKIERYLSSYGRKPYYVSCRTHKVKRAGEDFPTIAQLKEYYQITKLTKSGSGWAVNSVGTTIEWNEYEAEISEEFILK